MSDSFRSFLKIIRYIKSDAAVVDEYRVLALEVFIIHFHRLDLDLVIAAYVLDPNHKLEWVTDAAIHRFKIEVAEVLDYSGLPWDKLTVKRETLAYCRFVARNTDNQSFILSGG